MLIIRLDGLFVNNKATTGDKADKIYKLVTTLEPSVANIFNSSEIFSVQPVAKVEFSCKKPFLIYT